MERLTKIDGIGENDLIRCFGCSTEKAGSNLENCGYCEDGWRKALDRLAAYEDTGITPEAIWDILSDNKAMHEQLKEYREAEQEGRLTIRARVTGRKCGSCANFIPGEGTGPGWCKLREMLMNTYREPTDREFRPYRSRKACARDYVPREETEPQDDFIKKRFCEVV